jgi:hypothetical protein
VKSQTFRKPLKFNFIKLFKAFFLLPTLKPGKETVKFLAVFEHHVECGGKRSATPLCYWSQRRGPVAQIPFRSFPRKSEANLSLSPSDGERAGVRGRLMELVVLSRCAATTAGFGLNSSMLCIKNASLGLFGFELF